jgi:hypothetical protein
MPRGGGGGAARRVVDHPSPSEPAPAGPLVTCLLRGVFFMPDGLRGEPSQATESDSLVGVERGEAEQDTAAQQAAAAEHANAGECSSASALELVVGGLVALLSGAFCFLLVFQGLGDVFLPGRSGPCSPADPGSCGAVLRVVIAWLCLYFCFLFFQTLQGYCTKMGRPFRFGSTLYGGLDAQGRGFGGRRNAEMIADRTIGDMVEQSLPFLCMLALHATLLDSGSAAQLGWVWLLFRAIYPIVYAHDTPLLFVSTLPGYAIIAALAWPLFGLARCTQACGPHGTCASGVCVCDAVYEGKLYSTPWTGPSCEVAPLITAETMECCTTWCPTGGHGEAISNRCQTGFLCCDLVDCCGEDVCSYYSCERSGPFQSAHTCDWSC